VSLTPAHSIEGDAGGVGGLLTQTEALASSTRFRPSAFAR
jgi:hypothetical protein